MEWIPNQPVFFGDINACSNDEIYPVQLVDNTDDTQFQFRVSPCDAAEQLMPDPNFADSTSWVTKGGSNWSMADGSYCLAQGSYDETYSNIQFDTTKYYQINIVVDSISPGGSIQVSLGANILGYITNIGTFTYYGFPDNSDANTGIILTPNAVDTAFCTSAVTVFEILTTIIVAIYNSAGVYIDEIDYNNDATYFTFSEDTVTVTIDWSTLGLSNNCYYLCLLDPCINSKGQNYPPNILNCSFKGSATSWNLIGNCAYGTDNIYFDGNGIGSADQQDVFTNFTSVFCVTIVVSDWKETIYVSFGTLVVGTIATTGTFTFTGTPADFLSLTISVRGSKNGQTTIDSVCACTTDPLNFVCNYQSNTFKLADYTNDCTMLINACNNEDGLGFVFTNSGFTPRIRIEAKLRQAKYKNERNIYEDSKGEKKVIYFSGRKEKMLCTDLQPEYVHDFLRLLVGFDNFYLDGVLYSVDDDEYTVLYNEAADEIGSVRLTVSERTQNVKNINKSDSESICILGDSYLLQEDDLTQYITLTDGQKIIING